MSANPSTLELPNQNNMFLMVQMMSKMGRTLIKECDGSSIEFFTQKIKEGANIWMAPTERRKFFAETYKLHVEAAIKIMQQISFDWTVSIKALELGTGEVNEGRSHLSQYFPTPVTFTYSDIHQKFTQNMADENKKNCVQVDSCQFSKCFALSSLDLVLGACFVDCLINKDLIATINEIGKVLKEKGFFFHISDCSFFLNTLVFNHKDDDGVMFPWLNKDRVIQGIQFVSKKECNDFLESSKVSLEEKKFLKEYIAQTNDVRGSTVIEICIVPGYAFCLSNWVSQHFQTIQYVSNEIDFSSRVKDVLTKMNFEILQCGRRMLSIQREKKTEEDFQENDCTSFIDFSIRATNPIIPSQMIRKTQMVFMIIAQKKSSE